MSTQNTWLMLGAAVAGIVTAVGVVVSEYYRQEKKRHVLTQDLARLDRQMSVMRRELEQLRALQKENNSTKSRKTRRTRSTSVVSNSTTTTEDYASALDIDSSDLEFYDVSDDEDSAKTVTPLDRVLGDIDKRLDEGDARGKLAVLEELKDLNLEYPANPEILWRLAKAYHIASDGTKDVEVKKEYINKGLEATTEALNINADLSESHKWHAILVGSRSDYQAMKDRIADGHLFKKHVDIALRLNPKDASLHHMLGRFAFEVAGLKWYERKAAAALYGEPPSATYHEAMEHFKEAEKLAKKDWKENRLFIAKCHMALGDYESGVSWLENADRIEKANGINDKIDTEIKALLTQYNSYR